MNKDPTSTSSASLTVLSPPSVNIWQAFVAILVRDITVLSRYRSAWLQPLVFALVVVSLFALALSGQPSVLKAAAPAILWTLVMLAVLLSVASLFRDDVDDGSLEQYLLAPQSLYFTAMAKIIAHWLVSCTPLILASPLLVVMLGLPVALSLPVMLALVLGTGTLSCFGAIGAALSAGVGGSGLLVSILILPLYVPVVIFGAHYLQLSIDGWPVLAATALLASMFVAAMTLSPLAVAMGLRVANESS